jgi:hypothetical protein
LFIQLRNVPIFTKMSFLVANANFALFQITDQFIPGSESFSLFFPNKTRNDVNIAAMIKGLYRYQLALPALLRRGQHVTLESRGLRVPCAQVGAGREQDGILLLGKVRELYDPEYSRRCPNDTGWSLCSNLFG